MEREVSGKKILITGATGLMGMPLALRLAQGNTVFAAARFGNPADVELCRGNGIEPIAFDLANHDLSALPEHVDIVYNLGATVGSDAEAGARERVYDTNAFAVGRLATRYRDCSAFIHASSASVYRYDEGRPRREDDEYALYTTLETYAASKIGGEFILRYLSELYGLPTVILRVFSLFGPLGGGPTMRIKRVAHGLPVSVYPGMDNMCSPVFEDDYVDQAIAAIAVARSPAEVVNFAGYEPCSVQDYCRIAGEILGNPAMFEETSALSPACADTTKQQRLLGPCKVPVREGVERVIRSLGLVDAAQAV